MAGKQYGPAMQRIIDAGRDRNKQRAAQIAASRGGTDEQKESIYRGVLYNTYARQQALNPPTAQLRRDYSSWFDLAGDLYADQFGGDYKQAQRMAPMLQAANEGVNRFHAGMSLFLPPVPIDGPVVFGSADGQGEGVLPPPTDAPQPPGEPDLSLNNMQYGQRRGGTTTQPPREEFFGPEAVNYGGQWGLEQKAVSDQGPQVAYDPRGYYYEVGDQRVTPLTAARGFRPGQEQTPYNVQDLQSMTDTEVPGRFDAVIDPLTGAVRQVADATGNALQDVYRGIFGVPEDQRNVSGQGGVRALPENQVFTPPRPDDFQAPTQEEVYETLTDEEKADLWMQTQGITIRVSDDPYDPNAQRLKNQLELMYETGAIDDEDVQHLIDIGVLEQDAIDVDVTEQDTGTGTGRFYTYSNPYKYSFRYGSGGGGWGGYGSGGGGRGYASYASRQPNEFLSYPGFLPNVRWNF